jgi:hypothetical protein
MSEFGDALGGQDGSRLEENLEVVNLGAVDGQGGATTAETICIG